MAQANYAVDLEIFLDGVRHSVVLTAPESIVDELRSNDRYRMAHARRYLIEKSKPKLRKTLRLRFVPYIEFDQLVVTDIRSI